MTTDESRSLAQERRRWRAARARAIREALETLADEFARRGRLAQRGGETSGVREGMIVTWLAAEKLAREFAEDATDG